MFGAFRSTTLTLERCWIHARSTVVPRSPRVGKGMKKRSVAIGAEVVSEFINGEAMLLCLSTGLYFSLNATGAIVWQQIELHGDVEEIVATLATRHGVNEASVRDDVAELIGQLAKHGLVTRQ